MTKNPKTTKKRKPSVARQHDNQPTYESALYLLKSEIESVAYWKRSSLLTIQERESAAWLGATRAVKSFDPCKGASLRTWAQLKAKYAIDDEERRERRQRKRFGRNVGIVWSAPQTSQNDELTQIQRERAKQIVEFALGALDRRTREIVERVWFCGETQAEIARSFGFSQSWCSRLYRRGMAMVKEQASLAIERGF